MKSKKTKKRAITSYTKLGKQKEKNWYALGEAAVALTAGALMTAITSYLDIAKWHTEHCKQK